MIFNRIWMGCLLITTMSCGENTQESKEASSLLSDSDCISNIDSGDDEQQVRGALIATRFESLEELRREVNMAYFDEPLAPDGNKYRAPWMRLVHCSQGKSVVSILESGVSEGDIKMARDGNFWDRLALGMRTPYAVKSRNDLQRVFLMARRRYPLFGEGDVAFYDLALNMVHHINTHDLAYLSPADSSEKGFINTFNHMTAQAFVTSIFSERLADFIAMVHERHHMPELITGQFTAEQLADPNNNPVDNYVDIINNEWGQELGKLLKAKYKIDRNTVWTPELLANYLNDLQHYYGWALQIGFEPFRPTDEVVVRYSSKINRIMSALSTLK